MKKSLIAMMLCAGVLSLGAAEPKFKVNTGRKSATNGLVTFQAYPLNFSSRSCPDVNLLSGMTLCTIQTGKGGWSSVDFNSKPSGVKAVALQGMQGFELTNANSIFSVETKAKLFPTAPAVLLQMEWKAAAEVEVLRGSMPSVDFPAAFNVLTLPGKEAVTLEKGKVKNYQLRTWAMLSSSDSTAPSLLIIVPDLAVWDFSAGGGISVGGCQRGTGWCPGMNVAHPDFARNTLTKDDEPESQLIFAAVKPGEKAEDVYDLVMKAFHEMEELD